MSEQKIPDSRLYRFWKTRTPGQEDLLERFLRIGITPQDHPLGPLELVCACSLMLETRTTYAVYQSIDWLNNESIENRVDEEFFIQLDETIADLERAGLRAQARKLRKLGQGLASTQRNPTWQSRWEKETRGVASAAIKDEPFLPQRG